MSRFNEVIAENGRKGGLARGKKYHTRISKTIELFYQKPDLSQKELADELGVSQAFVSKYTSGLSKPYKNIDKKFLDEQIQIIINHLELRSKLADPMSKKAKINKV